MATGRQRVMWCEYWPISRLHGDVMPSSSHGKKCHGIHQECIIYIPNLVHIANVLASSTKVYQTRTRSDLQVILHSRKQMKWTAAHNPVLLITNDIVQWYRHSNCVLVTVATVSLLNSSVPQRPVYIVTRCSFPPWTSGQKLVLYVYISSASAVSVLLMISQCWPCDFIVCWGKMVSHAPFCSKQAHHIAKKFMVTVVTMVL